MDNHFLGILQQPLQPGSSSLGSSVGSAALLPEPLVYKHPHFNRSPDGPILKQKFKLEPMNSSQVNSHQLGNRSEKSGFDKTPVFQMKLKATANMSTG
jgi:hypothetical protein